MHIKRYQSWILAGISGILLILSFPSFNLYALGWISLIPLLIALQSTSKLEVRLSTRLPYRSDLLPRTGLLDHPTLPLRKYLPDYIRLVTASWLSRAVLRHLFRAATSPPVEVRSALHLGRDRNLDGVRMGAKLVFDRLPLGQHGLYTMEQPASNPDRLDHRRARR